MWNAVRFRETPWSYALGFSVASAISFTLSVPPLPLDKLFALVAYSAQVVAFCLIAIELVYGRLPLMVRGGQFAVVYGYFAVVVWMTFRGLFSYSEVVVVVAATSMLLASFLAFERTVRRTILFKYTAGKAEPISHSWSLQEMFSLTFLIAVLLAGLSEPIRNFREQPFSSDNFMIFIVFLSTLLILRGMLYGPGIRGGALCFALAGLIPCVSAFLFGLGDSVIDVAIPVSGAFFCGWRLRHVGWAIQPRSSIEPIVADSEPNMPQRGSTDRRWQVHEA